MRIKNWVQVNNMTFLKKDEQSYEQLIGKSDSSLETFKDDLNIPTIWVDTISNLNLFD